MANKIQLKRSNVSGKVPTTTDVDLGELALNTYDGKLYTKKSDGTTETVVQLSVDSTVVKTTDTGSVTSAMIADGTIVNGDINASAAIAGSKIDPDFGSQTVTTTGVISAAAGAAATPSIAFTGDLNTGLYSPGADQVAISTNGTGRLFVDASGNVGIGVAPKTWSTSGKAVDFLAGAAFSNNSGAVGEFDLAYNLYFDGTDWKYKAAGPASASMYSLQAGIHKWFTVGNGTAGSNATLSERLRITSTGQLSHIGGGSSGSPAVGFNGSAPSNSLVVDSSGRCLVGTSTARSNFYNGAFSNSVQVEGTTFANSGVSLTCNSSTLTNSSVLCLNKSAGTSVESNTVVTSGHILGLITFQGNDGTEFIKAADIKAEVDGNPGADDMPGRLVFSVTADGASSPTTSPSAMTINSGQEVLIGYSADNGAYKLQVNSQIFATSATIATSDGRYKENVVTLDGCVDLVKALRPVSFDWKHQEPITRIDEEGETVVVREAHNFPDGTQVGFIAQEVETVLADKPWLGSVIKQNVRPAVTDNDGNELAPEEEFLGIAEGNLVAVLTSALKDAIGEIESLKARVAALEAS